MPTTNGFHSHSLHTKLPPGLTGAFDPSAAGSASDRRSSDRDRPCQKHLLPQGRFLQHLRRAVVHARDGDFFALYVLHVDHLDGAESRNRDAAALLLRRLGLTPDHDPGLEICACRIAPSRFSLLKARCHVREVPHFAHRIRAALERDPFAWQGRAYRLGVSVGGTPLTGQLDAHAALECAGHACTVARDMGGVIVMRGEPGERATIDAEHDWHEHITRVLG